MTAPPSRDPAAPPGGRAASRTPGDGPEPAVPTVPLPLRRHPLPRELALGLERRLRGRVPGGGREPAIVAASGGPDSTALLLAAAVLAGRRRRPWPVPLVVHVHHHLRGADADADAAHVAALARALGLPFRRADVHPGAEPGNLAAAARRLRYAALGRAARDAGRRVVLTGHHAGDQLETILLRLARGAAPDRLAMPGVRPLTETPDRGGAAPTAAPPRPVRPLLVRPLLETDPERLASACAAAGVRPREDPGNRDRRRPRARLRSEVLPVLEAIAPGAATRAAAAFRDPPCPRDPVAARGGQGPLSVHDRAALAARPLRERSALLRGEAVRLAPAAADRLPRRVVELVAEAAADGVRAPRRWDWPAGLRVRLDAHRLELTVASAPPPTTPPPCPPGATPESTARFPDVSR